MNMSRAFFSRLRISHWGRRMLVLLLYVIVSAIVLNNFMIQWGYQEGSQTHSVKQMLTYSADRPFAYRVLTPFVVNAIAHAVPASFLKSRSASLLTNSDVLKYVESAKHAGWDEDTSLRFHIVYLYLFLCLIVTLFAIRAFANTLQARARMLADFVPVMFALLLPFIFRRGGYIYDFPELMLLFLVTLVLVKGRVLLFYPLYVLAILNKESNALLIVSFLAVVWGTLPRWKLAVHLCAQLVIGVGCVVFVRAIAAGNPGSTVWYQLSDNITFFLSPASYFVFWRPYAPMISLPSGVNIIWLLTFGSLIAHGWYTKPAWARRMFILTGSVSIPLLLLFSRQDEIRNLSLMFPAVFALVYLSLAEVDVPRAEEGGGKDGTRHHSAGTITKSAGSPQSREDS